MKLVSNIVNVQYSDFICAAFLGQTMGKCFRLKGLKKHPEVTTFLRGTVERKKRKV